MICKRSKLANARLPAQFFLTELFGQIDLPLGPLTSHIMAHFSSILLANSTLDKTLFYYNNHIETSKTDY
jgi:hypothetical protein